MTLYSVGYNALPVEELDDLAHKLDALIIDVRGIPKSRKSGYGRLQLERRFGDRLQWRGDVLGNKGGHGTTQAGLDALSEFRPDAGPHAILMCACGPPGHCHRHFLIAESLPFDVLHLWGDEVVRSSDLTDMMLRQKHDPDAEYPYTDLATLLGER